MNCKGCMDLEAEKAVQETLWEEKLAAKDREIARLEEELVIVMTCCDPDELEGMLRKTREAGL